MNKVKNPKSKHYELWDGVEAIDVCKAMLTKEEYIGALKFNILKYQLRLAKKDCVESDMEKIEDYKRELNFMLGKYPDGNIEDNEDLIQEINILHHSGDYLCLEIKTKAETKELNVVADKDKIMVIVNNIEQCAYNGYNIDDSIDVILEYLGINKEFE